MTALPDHKTHQGGNGHVPRPLSSTSSAVGDAVRTMLEARSVALVGASPRAASFGSRMLDEVSKSTARPRVYPVNPRYAELAGACCYPSLADLPEAPELALLAVPDTALEQQLSLAVETGCRSAVIFGNAHEGQVPIASEGRGIGDGSLTAVTGHASTPGLRDRLATIARDAGMALCGAGCMGFANVSHGLRALGYTEPDPLPAGPVALITHSGSVFSAMLRARRGFGFTLAVSSGQELVTAAPAYLDYALAQPGTRVLGLVLETIRDGAALREVLGRAAAADIPVVLLTAGSSDRGRAMVAAHSGALAGSDGGWEALARAYGVHRVSDLAEFTDTLELFSLGRRVSAGRYQGTAATPAGIAAVHDSGLERAHVADVAESLGVPFAEIGQVTRDRLASLLDPGLVPANPLDVWGTGADTRELFGGCMLALADDPAVEAVALAVDLVHEYDGDDSYPLALSDVAARTPKPLAVLSNLTSAIDPELARQLRGQGVGVLEGTRSGLLALRHLIDHARHQGADLAESPARQGGTHVAVIDRDRQARGAALLAGGQAAGAALLNVLAGYGIAVARSHPASDLQAALAAAEQVGYPVVLKTDEPGILHKSDVGGVVLGIADASELAAAYADLATRLGSRVLVCQAVAAGTELALGVVTDPELGPLIVIGAGGVLVELLADRAVALPPVSPVQAGELVAGLRVARLLAGVRGAPPADMDAVIRAVCGLSELAIELGDQLDALDINPLICGPDGAVAVDSLAVPGSLSAGVRARPALEEIPTPGE